MCLVRSDEVEDDVRTPSIRRLANGIHVPAVEHLVDAQLGGERTASLVRLERDHCARTELADELHRDVAHASDSDDSSRRPREEQRREPADGVIGRHPRVGVWRHGHRVDAGGKRDEGALGHAHLLGEATVDRQPCELVAYAVQIVAAATRDAGLNATVGVA